MNEKDFLTQIEKGISEIPKEERTEVLQDYVEHFKMAREDGKTDDEIIHSLGQPSKIIKEILAMHHITQVESNTTTGNLMRAIWAGIGLGFLNLIIVLGPFIALVSVIFSGWVTALALVVSPLILPVNLIIFPHTFEWFELFMLIGFCGLGILTGVLMYYLTKGFTWAFTHYLKFNVKLVKGGLHS